MNKSESIKNIATALSQFQSEVTNPKNTADNPFFRSKYAPLNDILNDVRPLLSKYGLSILQSPSGDGSNIVITTLLMHSSGEWIESEPLVLKTDKATAQGAGSGISYARRYAISAILGIASEDDDDGNHATGHRHDEPVKSTTTIATDKKITPAQVTRMFAIVKGKNDVAKSIVTKYGYESSKDILIKDYEVICKEIEQEVNKGDVLNVQQ